MKVFTFTNGSWYDQPACDCCQGGWINSFNSDQVNGNFGSAFSEEDCYLQAIATELGTEEVTDEHREGLYSMNLKELKEIAKDLNIKVEIIS